MSLRREQHRAWRHEMAQARRRGAAGEAQTAFAHLERAHIISQRDTRAHTLTHLAMLRHGARHRDLREVAGQLLRVPAALLKSRIWVPAGNTGGARVGPLRPMPVPDDLRGLVD